MHIKSGRLILSIIFILCLSFQASAWNPMVVVSGGGVSGWSTDFVDCTAGNVDDQTGWETNRNDSDNADRGGDFVCSSGTAYRGANCGVIQYLLAEYSLSDADYSIQVEAKVAAEANGRIFGTCLRCTVDSTGLTGYVVRVDTAGNLVDIYKYTDGSSATLLDDDAITDVDWTAFQTVKVSISGSATTTINFYVEGSLEATVDDSSSPITAANYAGMASYCGTGTEETFDDFQIIE